MAQIEAAIPSTEASLVTQHKQTWVTPVVGGPNIHVIPGPAAVTQTICGGADSSIHPGAQQAMPTQGGGLAGGIAATNQMMAGVQNGSTSGYTTDAPDGQSTHRWGEQ